MSMDTNERGDMNILQAADALASQENLTTTTPVPANNFEVVTPNTSGQTFADLAEVAAKLGYEALGSIENKGDASYLDVRDNEGRGYRLMADNATRLVVLLTWTGHTFQLK